MREDKHNCPGTLVPFEGLGGLLVEFDIAFTFDCNPDCPYRTLQHEVRHWPFVVFTRKFVLPKTVEVTHKPLLEAACRVFVSPVVNHDGTDGDGLNNVAFCPYAACQRQNHVNIIFLAGSLATSDPVLQLVTQAFQERVGA